MSNGVQTSSRLKIWREIVSAKEQPELEEVIAGRDAELALKSMVAGHLTWKSASIFHSKRVPRDPQSPSRGRYEIDLIVITRKQISAIEIKNWSGRLRIERGRWVQERRQKSEISHENPLEKNKEKLDCLCAFLEAKKIHLPNIKECKVIFWNNNLTVPLSIAERDEIVMRHKLDRFLSGQKVSGFGERFLISVLEYCLDQEASKIAVDGFFGAVGTQEFNAAVQAISELRTFDKIELLGGRVLSGDLLELRFGQQRQSFNSLPKGMEVKVNCTRNKVFLFFSALFGSSPMLSLTSPFAHIPIAPSDRVFFHQAGSAKPEEIDISRIVRIICG